MQSRADVKGNDGGDIRGDINIRSHVRDDVMGLAREESE